jgi:hypothetical protein
MLSPRRTACARLVAPTLSPDKSRQTPGCDRSGRARGRTLTTGILVGIGETRTERIGRCYP